MRKLFISVLALLSVSCVQENSKKNDKTEVKNLQGLAVKSAKIEILNQLPDPSNTAVEADSVTAINDTLFNIIGHFTTPTEKVSFNCDIAISRDGNSYQMINITTK